MSQTQSLFPLTKGDTLYVAIKGYRKEEEPECVGIWRDRAQAVKDISEEHNYGSEFSDPDNGFWGTEEWSIFLTEETILVHAVVRMRAQQRMKTIALLITVEHSGPLEKIVPRLTAITIVLQLLISSVTVC